MIRRGLFAVWVAPIVLWAIPACAQVSDLPVELAKFAKQHECLPITDFYRGVLSDDYIDRNPPPYPAVGRSYVYGYAKDGKESDSAVFWCENEKPSGTPYMLVFVYKNPRLDTDGCPNIIKNRSEAKGLSIVKGPLKSIEKFVYADDADSELPETARNKPSHDQNAVESSFGGIGEIYYCHNGKWLVRNIFRH